MSQENVELFKRGVEAANRFDVDGLLETLDPEVEWHTAVVDLLAGAVFRGHEAVRRVFQDFDGAFAEYHSEFWDVRDLGDRVLAIGQLRIVGKEGGNPVESPFAYLVRFRNGKAIWVKAFTDPKEALEAAGLSE
jgi:ketosteroid isomerase-like protein